MTGWSPNMVTREQAQNKWARNFAARLSRMASNMGDRQEYLNGVANYLGVDESSITGSESGQAILESFEENANMSASEIRNEVVSNHPTADSFDSAVSDLAQKWDSNYEAAYTG